MTTRAIFSRRAASAYRGTDTGIGPAGELDLSLGSPDPEGDHVPVHQETPRAAPPRQTLAVDERPVAAVEIPNQPTGWGAGQFRVSGGDGPVGLWVEGQLRARGSDPRARDHLRIQTPARTGFRPGSEDGASRGARLQGTGNHRVSGLCR
jgi:hypothetical protein